MVEKSAYGEGIEITKEVPDEFREILSPDAVAFVAKLAREFTPRVEERLQARQDRQTRINAGEMPDFLSETKDVREGDWKIAPIPDALQDRRVEVNGPPHREKDCQPIHVREPTATTHLGDTNCPHPAHRE